MRWLQQSLAALMASWGWGAIAQTTYTATSSADAFLCTGSPNNPELNGADLSGYNFGAAGTLVIAPSSSPKGEFQSVVKFGLAESTPLFNSAYGSNHWFISGATLEFRSNYGTAGVQPNNGIFPEINGGQFTIEWLADNDWPEGIGTPNLPTTDGVTYNSLPGLLSSPNEFLGIYFYDPPGDNAPVTYPLPLTSNVLADITNGSDISLLFRAADDQIAYLFNSHEFGNGNQPLIHVVAAPLVKILTGSFTNQNFLLTAIGPTNASYQVQASTNLATTNWQTIGTARSDAAGSIQFYDTDIARQPARYYRIGYASGP